MIESESSVLTSVSLSTAQKQSYRNLQAFGDSMRLHDSWNVYLKIIPPFSLLSVNDFSVVKTFLSADELLQFYLSYFLQVSPGVSFENYPLYSFETYIYIYPLYSFETSSNPPQRIQPCMYTNIRKQINTIVFITLITVCYLNYCR